MNESTLKSWIRNRRRQLGLALLATVVAALALGATSGAASAASGWSHDGRGHWFKDSNADGIYEEIRIDSNRDNVFEFRYLFYRSGDLKWMNFSAVGTRRAETWVDFRYRGYQIWFDKNEDGKYETRFYDARRDGRFERILTDSNGDGVADGRWGWLTATSSTSGGATASGWEGQAKWLDQLQRQCGCSGAELHEFVLGQLTAL